MSHVGHPRSDRAADVRTRRGPERGGGVHRPGLDRRRRHDHRRDQGPQGRPAGLRQAPVVDVGSSLVLPGLIDLHNHLAYNTLPLWTEPAQQTPFPHHNSWTRADSYAASTTWPAYALITACPQELLAYVEAKAIVGGTTSIQGSPPKNRPRDGWLVRNIEDETFGSHDANLIYASVLTAKPAALAERANKMRAGSAFIYHCSEGQRGTIVAREFTDAEAAGCLQPRFIATPPLTLLSSHVGSLPAPSPGIRSPTGLRQTTDVPAGRRSISSLPRIDLGVGHQERTRELKSARLTADHLGWSLSDQELVMMATCLPGDVLARAWRRQVGRLQPGHKPISWSSTASAVRVRRSMTGASRRRPALAWRQRPCSYP